MVGLGLADRILVVVVVGCRKGEAVVVVEIWDGILGLETEEGDMIEDPEDHPAVEVAAG